MLVRVQGWMSWILLVNTVRIQEKAGLNGFKNSDKGFIKALIAELTIKLAEEETPASIEELRGRVKPGIRTL
ncbi:hypothetical protein SUGI_0594730 [Cryptomeria japonica]|nr:hypothetical protein SUGI_0594730 [Cryptomeria japonica]